MVSGKDSSYNQYTYNVDSSWIKPPLQVGGSDQHTAVVDIIGDKQTNKNM